MESIKVHYWAQKSLVFSFPPFIPKEDFNWYLFFLKNWQKFFAWAKHFDCLSDISSFPVIWCVMFCSRKGRSSFRRSWIKCCSSNTRSFGWCEAGTIFQRQKLEHGASRWNASKVTKEWVKGPPSLEEVPCLPAWSHFHTTVSCSCCDSVFGRFKRFKFTNCYAIVHFAKNCSNVHVNGANFQEGKLA